MKLRGAFAAFVACAFVGSAQAQDTALVLQPTSAWTLDYAEDSCALRRQFGEGADQVLLEMRSFSLEGNLQITLAAKEIRPFKRDFQFRFDPEGEWRTAVVPMFTKHEGGLEGVFFTEDIHPRPEKDDETPAPAEWAAWRYARDAKIRAMTGLTTRRVFGRQVSLQTGPMTSSICCT